MATYITDDDKKDIEAIIARFNVHLANYNEGLSRINSKTSLLSKATVSFPEIPEIVIQENELNN